MPGLLLLLALLLAPHPNSLSSSRVVVEGDRASVTLRCQVLSYLEVLPRLDTNVDGEVDAAEVEEHAAAIHEYAAAHYRLFAGANSDAEGGRRLTTTPGSVRFLGPMSGETLSELGGAIELDFEARDTQELADLVLEVDLFRETSPDHIDLASVLWPNGVTRTFGLDVETPRARALPESEGTFLTFFELGFEHILGGWDHIAFLVALLLSSRRLRSVLGWVTAFTLAHSITLALATLGIVDVSAWSQLIESTIALSIAYVAADNLMRPGLERGRWIEAFTFGLLHGLGFAGFLASSLVMEDSKATALFSFNVGVELGQLAIVAVMVAPFALWSRKRELPAEFLMPLWLRRAGSACVVVLGLYWFFERI